MRESPFTKWDRVWRAVDAYYHGYGAATDLIDIGRRDGFIAVWRAFEKQGERATPKSVVIAAGVTFAKKAKGFAEGDFLRGVYQAGFQIGVKEGVREFFLLRKEEDVRKNPSVEEMKMLKSVFHIGRYDGYVAAFHVFRGQGDIATPDSVASGAEILRTHQPKQFGEGTVFQDVYDGGFRLGVKEAVNRFFPLHGKPQAAR